ncbi:MAG: DUF1540 domain-containing protein [Sumerlaeia bacterium]
MNPAPVDACAIEDCAYNRSKSCHAGAITIGSGDSPPCLTKMISRREGGFPRHEARVGACHQLHCRHNKGLQCHANHVIVGRHDGFDACLTHTPHRPQTAVTE